MDKATLIGLLAGISIVATAIALGSDPGQFFYVPALLIVFGGTIASTLIKFSFAEVIASLQVGKNAFIVKDWRPEDLIVRMKELSRTARASGLIALEQEEVPTRFFERGLQLCADGVDPAMMRRILSEDLEASVERHETGQRFFRSLGDVAPAFGMIGTLVGLVQMLGSLEDPDAIGPGMATALLTTLYGALFAQLVAIPIADALETRSRKEIVVKTLILEGVQCIREGYNPQLLEEVLTGYLPTHGREKLAAMEEAANAARRAQQGSG